VFGKTLTRNDCFQELFDDEAVEELAAGGGLVWVGLHMDIIIMGGILGL
jgi:hypothetical protein